jgi:hypothetical protein
MEWAKEGTTMEKVLSCVGVGLFGVVLGLLIGLRMGQEDHWKAVREFRRLIEDPASYEPSELPGLAVLSDPPDIGPNLAALVAAGELNHVDLVFPNVPCTREVTRYWMQESQAIDGVVWAYTEDGDGRFETQGVQPFHMNLWFVDEAAGDVKDLIAGIGTFAEREQEEPGS